MKHHKVIIVLLSILLSPSIALAAWAKLSPEELVGQAQLAIVGEFIGTTRITTQETGKNLIVGIIKIEIVLDGSVQDDFLLIAIRNVGAPSISTTINFRPGQKGLWLLKQYSSTNTTLYNANHPQQFTPYNDIKTLEHLKSLITKQKRTINNIH